MYVHLQESMWDYDLVVVPIVKGGHWTLLLRTHNKSPSSYSHTVTTIPTANVTIMLVNLLIDLSPVVVYYGVLPDLPSLTHWA